MILLSLHSFHSILFEVSSQFPSRSINKPTHSVVVVRLYLIMNHFQRRIDIFLSFPSVLLLLHFTQCYHFVAGGFYKYDYFTHLTSGFTAILLEKTVIHTYIFVCEENIIYFERYSTLLLRYLLH